MPEPMDYAWCVGCLQAAAEIAIRHINEGRADKARDWLKSSLKEAERVLEKKEAN